jgi:hypothetical protein
VPYTLTLDSLNKTTQLCAGQATIGPKDSTVVACDLGSHWPVERPVELAVVPGTDHFLDANSQNNVAVTVMSLCAAAYDATGFVGGTFTIPSVASIAAESGSLAPGVVVATLRSSLADARQPWTFLAVGDSLLSGAELELKSSDAGASGDLTLNLLKDTLLNADLRVVRLDGGNRLWLGYPSQHVAGDRHVTARVPLHGHYAVVAVDDRQGPTVKFTVEGSFFADSSVVPPDARFSATAFDASGIDQDSSRVQVVLDGAALEYGRDYQVLDSTITPTAINVRIERQLSPGHHRLAVTFYDRLGNATTKATEFDVETELSVRIFGNFPNPFDAETFLGYEIHGASIVDQVEFKLFTTSGKLIRTFRYPSHESNEFAALERGGTGLPTAVGYHEIWWDGRDADGIDVANGVYFYRLRVTLGDATIERSGAMARVR